jgi:hypothetical protein
MGGKKGLHVSTTLSLIIAAIILIIFAPMLVKVSAEVRTSILELLGLTKFSNVEKAALCAYYRCVEGCKSIRMDEITWTEKDEMGKQVTVSCQKFCQTPPECNRNPGDCFDDTKDLKICSRDKSMKFPVKVTISTSEEIDKERLNTFKLDCCWSGLCYGICIETESHYASNYWTFDGGCEFNLAGVKSKLVGEKDVCVQDVTGLQKKEGYKKVKIGAGTYYVVFSQSYLGLVWGSSYKDIDIFSKDEFKSEECKKNIAKDQCESNNCQWCQMCKDNMINKFLEDTCTSKNDDCGYQNACYCYSQTDCNSNYDCYWCSGNFQCINKVKKSIECPSAEEE